MQVAVMFRRAAMSFVVGLLAILFVPAWVSAQDVGQMLAELKPRAIGPANMSGRVTEIAVYEKEPRIMYLAAAAGGVWRTVNNGTTWTPVFDKESTHSIGAVAVFQQDPNIVWVGTGEANARNSVSWGNGVYRSTDGGKTWKHLGLKDTRHIGRIVTHPTNPDIAYVAALGRLWAANEERGLFKTSDGGQTWHCVKFLDQDTGFIDLAIDPEEPNILYAAAYQVRRDAFSGGNPRVQTGPKAGLYKSTDGGETWEKMTAGLPSRPFGRCGISVCRKNPNIVYAVVQTDKTSVTVQGQGPNNKKLNSDAGGIFRSDDKGKTWKYLNSLCPRPFYYGQIRVDPNDDKRVYVLGIWFYVSNDGGKTFIDANSAKGTHSDYHALWINPRDSHHLVLGSDGGLYFSYDKGQTWEHLKNLPLSQFYAIGVDMRKPYRIYGGLQDNGSWGGPSATRNAGGITIGDWFNVLGYDGYYCQIDPDDPDTVYCEGQYGIFRRVNVRTWEMKDIKPRLAGKDVDSNIKPAPKNIAALRFNWSTPILLSPHNPKTVWYASQFLFRSDDRGDTWVRVSRDLTRGKPGDNDYKGHTITTVSESPKKAGLLYVGTDDGKVWMTRNGGDDWTDLSDNVPTPLGDGKEGGQDRWITRVECSPHDEAIVYLSIDRHRNDDVKPYLFKSTNYGQTWTSIVGNLPGDGPIHVIRTDPRNPDLLYVGTEYGLYVSLDGGGSWHKQRHLPPVPVHDLAVHPRDRELVIATHGRGIYIMDALPLQELTASVLKAPAYLCTIRPASAYRQKAVQNLGPRMFTGENPTYGAGIYYYFAQALPTNPVITITDEKGMQVAQVKGFVEAGLHRLTWRLNVQGTKQGFYRPVPPGTYTVTLRAGGQTLRQTVQVDVEGGMPSEEEEEDVGLNR